MPDTLQLPAATMLYLAAGKADWLSGRSVFLLALVSLSCLTVRCDRYVEATWDLEDVERIWKDRILESNALVSKLSLPE